MKKKLSILLSLLLIFFSSSFSQLPMTRSVFFASYDSIYPGGGATTSTATGDEGIQTGIPIGFTFNYLGTNYTTVGVGTNGNMGFAAFSSSFNFGQLYTAGGLSTILCPWWGDLTISSGASIRYQTIGPVGSRKFVVQWTRVPSHYVGSTQRLNFQVILYETTNVIEFKYGSLISGTSGNETASIGIKNSVGGPGQFIDAVSGSSYTGSTGNAAKFKWPYYHYRFTPGTPAPIAGGTYLVGVGQTYTTLPFAFADLNHKGISGPVNLVVVDTLLSIDTVGGRNYFPALLGPIAGSSSTNLVTVGPSSGTTHLHYDGTGLAGIYNQSTYINQETVISLVGAQYVNIHDLYITTTTNVADVGIGVFNSSATLGSRNNTIEDVKIRLNETNTSSVGILQFIATVPSSSSGTNSDNQYLNLDISHSYYGIKLSGSTNFPDMNCVIGNTNPVGFNIIGPFIGSSTLSGTTEAYGIYMGYQSNVQCYNNEVTDVKINATSGYVSGIYLDRGQGINEIHNNKVHGIRNLSFPGNWNVSGIKSNLLTTGSHQVKIYNNFVSDVTAGDAGSPNSNFCVTGIWLNNVCCGTASQIVDIANNTIVMDGSASPNTSNTCINAYNNSLNFKIRNNILANYTGPQTSPAFHTGIVVQSENFGFGSFSDHNDFYISNSLRGCVAYRTFLSILYPTLTDWQMNSSQDANSISADPLLVNIVTNLHTTSSALANNGTPLAWIVNDIDNDSRFGNPDIGADEFSIPSGDVGITSLSNPTISPCYSSAENLVIQLTNFDTDSIDFFENPVIYTLNVTGPVTASFVDTLVNNTLNGGLKLAPSQTLNIPVGVLDMSQTGIYTFNSFTNLVGDLNHSNDTMVSLNFTNSAPTQTLFNVDVCSNTLPYTFGGNNYSIAGTYSDTLSNIVGCDSIIILNLSISPASSSSTNASVCSNSLPYVWNGNNYSLSGIYTDTLINAVGCDSIMSLNLLVHNSYSYVDSITICSNLTPYVWHGNSYFSSGIYYDSSATVFGCDSISALHLTVNSTSSLNSIISVCSGLLPYSWNGDNYFSSGNYTDTLINVNGCDSIITLDLTVNPVDTSVMVSGNILNAVQTGGNYQWVDCNGGFSLILGATSSSYTVVANGSYALMVAYNGCLDTSSCYTFTNLSMDNLNSTDGFSVVPNPTSGIINIYSEKELSQVKILIMDIAGKIVHQLSEQDGKTFVTDLSNFQSGIYFIYLLDKENQWISLGKIVKI